MHFKKVVARRSARWGLVFFLLVCAGSLSITSASAAPYKGITRPAPRAIRYRYSDDSIAHQESSMAAVRRTKAGGAHAYYGNRLTQFQFIGPAGQGGIYDALKNHKEGRPLDAKNYQYRW
jgi:hypothetical protein